MPIEAVRIELYAPVASFRDPMFPGVSRCLPVPPPSTVRGMLAAATGNPAEPVCFGMAACADGRGVDAETYHPVAADGSNPPVRGRVGEGKGGMTVRERPFLADVRVTLWVPDPDGQRIARALRRPVWGLRLGRSQDLVHVRSISRVMLYPAGEAVVGHALAPLGGHASARASVVRLADQVSLDRMRTIYRDYLWCADPAGREATQGAYRDGDQAVWLHAADSQHDEPAELLQVLAKSASHSPLGRPELLTEHSLQVRRAADDLADRISTAGVLAGHPRFWSWVATAALLHDAGKVAEGFQRQLRPKGEPWGERHEVLSLAFVELLTRHLPEQDRQMIATGVLFHHQMLIGAECLADRYPPEADWQSKFGLNNNAFPGQPRIQVSTSRRAAALAWYARQLGVPAPQEARKLWDLARDAFARTADWWMREVPPAEGLLAVLVQGAVTLADHSGSAHVTLRKHIPLPSRYLDGLASPYAHQIQAGGHDGHLIVRAPTGSGKTEAGLAWASRQLESMPGRPRLIWQLPYRASIDAARTRFLQDLNADPDDIAILHATAAQTLLAECTSDDQHAGRAQARKAKAQRAAMRLFAQRIRIATPHQLLRAAIAGPRYSGALIEQSNAAMVLDELHAYDPVTFGRICAAMRLWAQLGSRVCVLSATLAQPMIDLVAESLTPAPVTIIDAPQEIAPDRHRLVVDEEPICCPASVARIHQWLAEGHGVLVVANTVARAQCMYRLLTPAACATYPDDPDAAILLHSRFRHMDRDAIEKRIRQRYPEREEGERERRGGLVIATQALEVSLCLDFDRGVSELAPVEAIAQRAGRVNRRGRHPDGAVEFRVHLTTKTWPYEEAALKAALLALREHPGPIISEETISAWLKTAYATEWGREWENRARESRDAFSTSFLTFTTPFHDRAEFADRLARELDSVDVLLEKDLARYHQLAAEDPLLAHRLLIPMRYGAAVRHGTRSRELRLFVTPLPYTPEEGLLLPSGEDPAPPPSETVL
ncbi:CRISPR-associated helicase Cas3' [Sphaerisporangium sp. NPDC051017]|uniref:CRISPR-associated helicase Cas3' n=1 Tax=unclassified Sphaerisporangium TaxID=2630420 RepID=UPI00340E2CCC